MDYKLKIGEEIRTVQAAPPDETGYCAVTVGEEGQSILGKAVSPNHLHLQADRKSLNLFVSPDSEGTWVWVEGRARHVQDAEKAHRRRSRGPTTAPTEITPPTPASVVKILVEPGQAVLKGQPVVVVSAMKMEITLAAPYAGIVTAVNTQVGAQVSPGQILVDIEPIGDEGKTEEK